MLTRLIAKHRSELPLKEDKANFFLEISITISVFLFSMALAAYFMISQVICSWDNRIIDGLTVQIMPSEETLSTDEEMLRINKVVHFFEGLDGVKKVKQIDEQKIKHLMAPWIGENANIEELPLPVLLDVRLINGKTFDYEKARDSLYTLAPYASIDNHGVWLKKLVKSATSLKTLSVFILILVLIAAVFSSIYAVQTSLKVHQNIIEILHIMGATDDYVAKQYAFRGFLIGLFSSAVGTILSLIALHIVSHLSSGLETGLIGAAGLSTMHWFVLASIPLLAGFIAMLTSFLSVKHTLKEMM